MATEQELIVRATAMLDRSYAPYSHFPVGAALECDDGTIYTGCNVENASYGLTICAERTAAFKAVSEGHRSFRRIAIAGRCETFCWPCGACRQVLYEFGGSELELVCLNSKGEAARVKLGELLPHGMDSAWLGR